MRNFLHYISLRPVALICFIVLIILYAVMLCAEFIAPYSPTTSFHERTYCPPNIRAKAHNGALLQVQENRITDTISFTYARVKGAYTPVRFFVKGERYKIAGIIPADRHLFGTVDNAGTGANVEPVFLLGADNLGRDIFSRIVYGSRISLSIGFAATAISLTLALLFGGLAGYFGGKTDWFVMRFAEFFMLIPSLYLILFLRSLFAGTMDTGKSYILITVILSLVGWTGTARTIRGLVHSVKNEDFVLNAQIEGAGAGEIIFLHIVPQFRSLLIVMVALNIPAFIMSETALSYLGLGIADPAVSWGSMIKREISTLGNLKAYPWLLSPVYFLLAVTLAFNFLADALRDFFDPYHNA
ncbi:MAG: ABC transporter permease [Treponemataceae bacterium]|nr:MAG: ABC transporter permease [Treponemataceae bacterium]